MGNTLTKSIDYISIINMFQNDHPEFASCSVKVEFPQTQPTDTYRIILSNGDEYDYTIESIKTKLVKVERKYRFAEAMSRDDIIRAYCLQQPSCHGACIFSVLDERNLPQCGTLPKQKQLERLIKAGIVEEVK